MIITIDLPPHLEARLQAEANRRGMTIPGCIISLLEQAIPQQPTKLLFAEERKQLVEDLCGSLADSLLTAEDFLRDKHEENDREEAELEEWLRGGEQ